ncbi:hypothetical protein AB1Y20_022894 [Prymnesium parvum]|uniref:nicotinamidase n=1 Tax=Prymnesium parvum TaxID=97485 RepID=A0AB34JEN3_PRYPA
MASPSSWDQRKSPLFREWCQLAGGREFVPERIVHLSADDALVIIDMQKDFVPADASNPDGGRFGVAEGQLAVPQIVRLIRHAASTGATCVATRDYHPHDHVSFSTQGGPFPEHCVQGTVGSEFLSPIGAALSEARQARPGAVHVAFKAMHEDVDSFGGLPYMDGAEGRLTQRPPGKQSTSFCVGCSACPWSGAIVVKQSALSAAARRKEAPDMNAPPDMLAVCGDAEERGGKKLEALLTGARRLLVCGLALDFCVLDTCMNARLCGFEQVVVLLDATRASHIPGVGPHGSGFLVSPSEVVCKLRKAGVTIATYRDLFPPSAEQSLAEELQDKIGESNSMFPHRLGPFPLEESSTLAIKVDASADRYTVELTGSLSGLANLDFNNTGVCCPLATIPKGWPTAAEDAVGLRWCYPLDGMAAAAQQSLYTHFLEVGISVDKCFVAYGGFLLLNAAGEVVAAQAVMSTVRGEAIPKIHFLRQETCPPSIVSELRGDGRLRNVTLPALLSCGVESFCWVNPHEPPQGGQDDQMTAHRVTRKKNKELTKHGAFLYTFANGSEAIWFHVMDPKKVLQAHKEAQATIQEYRRSHMIRGAVVHRRGMQLYEQAVATEERKSYFRTASSSSFSSTMSIRRNRVSPSSYSVETSLSSDLWHREEQSVPLEPSLSVEPSLSLETSMSVEKSTPKDPCASMEPSAPVEAEKPTSAAKAKGKGLLCLIM